MLTENAIQDKNSDYKKIHFLYNRLVYYRAELFEHSNLKEWLAISREIDPTCKFRQIPHKFIQKSNLKSDLKKEDISWEPLDYELELKVENF